MKRSLLHVVVAATACSLAGLLVSCASQSEPTVSKTSSSSFQPGVPGGVTVETHHVTTKVTHVDREARVVTIAVGDGETEDVRCGPEVRNFDRIHAGDEVNVVLVQETVVSMASKAQQKESSKAAVLMARAPEGGEPAAVVAHTVEVVATVTSLDVANHRATLTLPGGSSKTIDVRPDVDLTQRKVGEHVYIRYTQAVAISVEKPADK